MSDPFNCPGCGSHDYGLYGPKFGFCPWCAKYENGSLRSENADLRARLEEARKNDERWQYLESLQCNQFILSKNEEHASNYVTAREWIEEFCPDDFKDTPLDEIQRMKETNTIWRLQIYPDTPIGFYVFFAATLQAAVDAAIDAAIAQGKGEK